MTLLPRPCRYNSKGSLDNSFDGDEGKVYSKTGSTNAILPPWPFEAMEKY